MSKSGGVRSKRVNIWRQSKILKWNVTLILVMVISIHIFSMQWVYLGQHDQPKRTICNIKKNYWVNCYRYHQLQQIQSIVIQHIAPLLYAALLKIRSDHSPRPQCHINSHSGVRIPTTVSLRASHWEQLTQCTQLNVKCRSVPSEYYPGPYI